METPQRYDAFSVLLHWLIALLVISLFISGIWIVELDYYDRWYYRAPWWHKGVGMVLMGLLLIRSLWMAVRQSLSPLESIPAWQHQAARLVHGLMNFFILLMGISGYLMVTAKGNSLSVFDWFAIPALIQNKPEWVDFAGLVHLWLAYTMIALASLHALAAVKHHFIDKDATLWRMLGIKTGDNP